LLPSRLAQFEEAADERFLGTRFFILPPGMVPVPRTSPIRVRKRTPWHPKPDAEPIDRIGGRDWFGAHLTLEAQRRHKPAMYSLAVVAHAAVSLAIVAAVMLRRDSSIPQIHQPFMVPVLLSLPSASKLFAPTPKPPSSDAVPAVPPPPPAAPVPVEKEEPAPSAPVQAPEGVKAEPEAGPVGIPQGTEGGTAGGVTGGVVGGQVNGSGEVGKAAAPSAPLRLGPGIEPPVKIKDVKPIYPQEALASRLRGTVVIEATIGIDGKVHDARVVRSIAGLDQAALDAVRQWVFEPARLNGVPVAVIMSVPVAFAII
jgi:periplasmic protein TonB